MSKIFANKAVLEEYFNEENWFHKFANLIRGNDPDFVSTMCYQCTNVADNSIDYIPSDTQNIGGYGIRDFLKFKIDEKEKEIEVLKKQKDLLEVIQNAENIANNWKQ